MRGALACLLLALTGCAATLPGPPGEELRARFGSLRVVPAEAPPTVAITRPAAAAAAAGGAGCLVGGLYSLEFLLWGWPWALVTPGTAAAGGVAGSAFGASGALDADQRARAEGLLKEALAAPGGSEALAREVARSAGLREESAPPEGGDSPALEVAVEEVRLEPLTPWPGRRTRRWHVLSLRASARLRAPEAGTAYDRSVVALGTPTLADGWGEPRPEAVRESVTRLVTAAAEQLTDEVVRLYPLPDQGDGPTGAGGGLSEGYGLRVVEAKRSWRTRFRRTAASVTPTLAWEAFPRDADRNLTPDVPARVSDVVYDLRLAPMDGNLGVPSHAVYARDGLPEPRHTVEVPLEPERAHFWTVRARFRLDGRPRTTEWSCPNARGRRTAPPLNRHSYEFVPPGS